MDTSDILKLVIIKMFFIKRNTTEFGPYSAEQIKKAFLKGSILLKDSIRHENTANYITVKEFLKLNNLQLKQEQESLSDILLNIFKINGVFFNPFQYIKTGIKENTIILYLLGIVLIPILAMFFSEVPIITYTIYGFYFALIWGIILYKTIATPQVEIKKTVLIAFGTIVISAILIFGINLFIGKPINQLITSKNFFYNLVGMFFGVALIEEFCKQSIVFTTIFYYPNITFTRTAIFYGMIAGLAFGITEGVEYQISINKELEVDQNYFYNILRLTSLPFFHAIWAGIGAYFSALSFIDLKYKYTFRIFSILIPAILHAIYNTFGFNIFGISTIVLSALLLMVYLTKSDQISLKLNNL